MADMKTAILPLLLTLGMFSAQAQQVAQEALQKPAPQQPAPQQIGRYQLVAASR